MHVTDSVHTNWKFCFVKLQSVLYTVWITSNGVPI